MADQNLVHCIYTSSLAPGLDDQELRNILKKARENNAELGVSGMLLFDSGAFFQVLEGPKGVVGPLYAKIAGDPRHQHVVKLIEEPIEERDFSDWTMGIANLRRQELAAIPGLNDFFAGGGSFAQLDEGRAKNLLAAFREGRWRSSIS